MLHNQGMAKISARGARKVCEVKAKLDEISKALMDGTLKTCVPPAKGAPAPEGCTGTGTGDAMTTPAP